MKPKINLRPINLPEDILLAKKWYSNPVVLEGSEGKGSKPYNESTLQRMYTHLSSIGEVFIIEIIDENSILPIGDATLSKETLPIVIGHPSYHHKGIGKQVLNMLIAKARDKGWLELNVQTVYDYNLASQRLYESVGFKKVSAGKTKDGIIYYSYKLLF